MPCYVFMKLSGKENENLFIFMTVFGGGENKKNVNLQIHVSIITFCLNDIL